MTHRAHCTWPAGRALQNEIAPFFSDGHWRCLYVWFYTAIGAGAIIRAPRKDPSPCMIPVRATFTETHADRRALEDYMFFVRRGRVHFVFVAGRA